MGEQGEVRRRVQLATGIRWRVAQGWAAAGGVLCAGEPAGAAWRQWGAGACCGVGNSRLQKQVCSMLTEQRMCWESSKMWMQQTMRGRRRARGLAARRGEHVLAHHEVLRVSRKKWSRRCSS